MSTPIQNNSEALERILQAVNNLPEGTQLPTLSNAGSASDLVSGKQLIDQNGNIITGTHQCQSGSVTVQRKTGTVTLQHGQNVTINCGFKPDVVFLKAGSYKDDSITYNSSTAIVFAEESRNQPFTPLYTDEGIAEVFWTQNTNGFSVNAGLYDSSWDDLGGSFSCNYVAIKYTN